jgi:small subunit ribosomal protein S7
MSRRRRVIHKEIKKDARYASPVVARLISTVMRRGKKSIAEHIVYTAIDKSREGTDTVDPLETLNKAIENVKPRLEVKSRRVGGATYQVNGSSLDRQLPRNALDRQLCEGPRGVPMENALARS